MHWLKRQPVLKYCICHHEIIFKAQFQQLHTILVLLKGSNFSSVTCHAVSPHHDSCELYIALKMPQSRHHVRFWYQGYMNHNNLQFLAEVYRLFLNPKLIGWGVRDNKGCKASMQLRPKSQDLLGHQVKCLATITLEILCSMIHI